jgi:hypothetical protein
MRQHVSFATGTMAGREVDAGEGNGIHTLIVRNERLERYSRHRQGRASSTSPPTH